MVIDDDLQRGVNPLDRQPLADSRLELAQLMAHPLRPVDPEAVDEDVSVVVVLVRVVRPALSVMEMKHLSKPPVRVEAIGSPILQSAC